MNEFPPTDPEKLEKVKKKLTGDFLTMEEKRGSARDNGDKEKEEAYDKEMRVIKNKVEEIKVQEGKNKANQTSRRDLKKVEKGREYIPTLDDLVATGEEKDKYSIDSSEISLTKGEDTPGIISEHSSRVEAVEDLKNLKDRLRLMAASAKKSPNLSIKDYKKDSKPLVKEIKNLEGLLEKTKEKKEAESNADPERKEWANSPRLKKETKEESVALEDSLDKARSKGDKKAIGLFEKKIAERDRQNQTKREKLEIRQNYKDTKEKYLNLLKKGGLLSAIPGSKLKKAEKAYEEAKVARKTFFLEGMSFKKNKRSIDYLEKAGNIENTGKEGVLDKKAREKQESKSYTRKNFEKGTAEIVKDFSKWWEKRSKKEKILYGTLASVATGATVSGVAGVAGLAVGSASVFVKGTRVAISVLALNEARVYFKDNIENQKNVQHKKAEYQAGESTDSFKNSNKEKSAAEIIDFFNKNKKSTESKKVSADRMALAKKVGLMAITGSASWVATGMIEDKLESMLTSSDTPEPEDKSNKRTIEKTPSPAGKKLEDLKSFLSKPLETGVNNGPAFRTPSGSRVDFTGKKVVGDIKVPRDTSVSGSASDTAEKTGLEMSGEIIPIKDTDISDPAGFNDLGPQDASENLNSGTLQAQITSAELSPEKSKELQNYVVEKNKVASGGLSNILMHRVYENIPGYESLSSTERINLNINVLNEINTRVIDDAGGGFGFGKGADINKIQIGQRMDLTEAYEIAREVMASDNLSQKVKPNFWSATTSENLSSGGNDAYQKYLQEKINQDMAEGRTTKVVERFPLYSEKGAELYPELQRSGAIEQSQPLPNFTAPTTEDINPNMEDFIHEDPSRPRIQHSDSIFETPSAAHDLPKVAPAELTPLKAISYTDRSTFSIDNLRKEVPSLNTVKNNIFNNTLINTARDHGQEIMKNETRFGPGILKVDRGLAGDFISKIKPPKAPDFDLKKYMPTPDSSILLSDEDIRSIKEATADPTGLKLNKTLEDIFASKKTTEFETSFSKPEIEIEDFATQNPTQAQATPNFNNSRTNIPGLDTKNPSIQIPELKNNPDLENIANRSLSDMEPITDNRMFQYKSPADTVAESQWQKLADGHIETFRDTVLTVRDGNIVIDPQASVEKLKELMTNKGQNLSTEDWNNYLNYLNEEYGEKIFPNTKDGYERAVASAKDIQSDKEIQRIFDLSADS